jgi:hypothetical protein
MFIPVILRNYFYEMGGGGRYQSGRTRIGFLTQQYRLFSNYSASLQMDICYSDYT